MKNIICFLTIRPCIPFYNFCKTLINDNYDVYICIDDNSYTIPKHDNNIKIIKINNNICLSAGFCSLVGCLNNKSCSKDKALYYFCKNNINYDYIWFIEEDVFIPTINTITNIDLKYNNSYDLLMPINTDDKWYINNTNEINITDKWGWSKLINLQFSYLKKIDNNYTSFFNQTILKHNMTNSIRLSKKYINIINDFVKIYNTLFMDEIFYYNIAHINNLNIEFPEELKTNVYRKKWEIKEIKETNLYHPIKSINLQYTYRTQLKK